MIASLIQGFACGRCDAVTFVVTQMDSFPVRALSNESGDTSFDEANGMNLDRLKIEILCRSIEKCRGRGVDARAKGAGTVAEFVVTVVTVGRIQVRG